MKDENRELQVHQKHLDLVSLKGLIDLLYCAEAYKMSKAQSLTWWEIHIAHLFRLTMARNRFTFMSNLRLYEKETRIEKFVDSKHLPKDQDIRDLLANNKMDKQKRCSFCPPILDRKTNKYNF